MGWGRGERSEAAAGKTAILAISVSVRRRQ